jgi:predicted nucleic acid-binding Zn ribbon protein
MSARGCPSCARSIGVDNDRCPYCGVALAALPDRDRARTFIFLMIGVMFLFVFGVVWRACARLAGMPQI